MFRQPLLPSIHITRAVHIRKEQDKSMNRDEASYQLSHIYDYLMFVTATPGGQSFQRRQQQLPKRQQQQQGCHLMNSSTY